MALRVFSESIARRNYPDLSRNTLTLLAGFFFWRAERRKEYIDNIF